MIKKLAKSVYVFLDGENKAEVTIYSDKTFELYRIKVNNESFIEDVKNEVYEMIKTFNQFKFGSLTADEIEQIEWLDYIRIKKT